MSWRIFEKAAFQITRTRVLQALVIQIVFFYLYQIGQCYNKDSCISTHALGQ